MSNLTIDKVKKDRTSITEAISFRGNSRNENSWTTGSGILRLGFVARWFVPDTLWVLAGRYSTSAQL
jgi:hypothetical protein